MRVIQTPDDEKILTQEPDLLARVTREECWHLCYGAALRGVGFVTHNPPVGAVLVDRNHRFLAIGAHLEFGGPHAEVNLLSQINKRGLDQHLAGSTLYVTLEPCAHQGKTPSCAAMLSDLPLGKVEFANRDPNPNVDGKGIAILEKIGRAHV